MTMSAKATVMRHASRMGLRVEAEADERTFVVRCEAPPLYRYADEDIHEMVESCYLPWRTAAWEEMARRLATASVEPCDTEGCDWCDSTRKAGAR